MVAPMARLQDGYYNVFVYFMLLSVNYSVDKFKQVEQ